MLRPRLAALSIALAAAVTAAPLVSGAALAADQVVVRPGDTLSGIADAHGVPMRRIVRLNGIVDPSRIYAGQRLRLEAADRDRARPRASTPRPATRRTHAVRSGEHLTGIARQYGVTIEAIVMANAIADASRIFAGQLLTIPGAASATPAPRPPDRPAPSAVHVVAGGDTLTAIARRYGTTIAAVASANGIADPSRIYVGQRLMIPGARADRPARPDRASRPPTNLPSSMADLVASRDAVRRVIVAEARRYGVPPAFALAVAWQESGWQQGVVSSAGAIGVMQLLPSTADWVGEAMLGTRVDPTRLRPNVRAGVRLLAYYLDRYDGSRDHVLAAYYQGPTAVDRHGIYPVSRPYIASIRVLEALFAR